MTAMNVCWVMSFVPGELADRFRADRIFSGGWIAGMRGALVRTDGVRLRLAFPVSGSETVRGSCETESWEYVGVPRAGFRTELARILSQDRPDVIHIWGTEYAAANETVEAAKAAGLQDRVIVWLQGVISEIANYYRVGLPPCVLRGATPYELIRKCSIRAIEKRCRTSGKLEVRALEGAAVILGRTEWDYACMEKLGLERKYRTCRENLRDSFYHARWNPERCEKHAILCSRGDTPIKGLHRMLPALAVVLRKYPDTRLYVAGEDPTYRTDALRRLLKKRKYTDFIRKQIKDYRLEDHVVFLGPLTEEQMLEAYLRANVFVLPSTIENSPNSLGEAMLLGMPCVAADVGGVSSMMTHGAEGLIYQGDSPAMLAHAICTLFDHPDRARTMGSNASERAAGTHDRTANLEDLLDVYRSLKTNRT